MTHSDLVERAAKWLQGSMRCPVVLTEFCSAAGEEPDAIGWKYQGLSYLVEVKVSRQDFTRDKKKMWRRGGGCHAVGLYRYYMTEPGLVKPKELPRNWGLLEVHGSRVMRIVEAKPSAQDSSGVRREVQMLMSALRRPLYRTAAESKRTTIRIR